jgi:hypothetical protein
MDLPAQLKKAEHETGALPTRIRCNILRKHPRVGLYQNIFVILLPPPDSEIGLMD